MLRSFRFSSSFEWPCSYIVADAWTKKERYSVCNVKVSQLWALIEREDFQSLRLSCEPIAPTLSPPSFLSFQSSPTLQKVLHYHSFKYIFSLLFLFKPPSRLPSPPVRNKGINPPADQWIPSAIQISTNFEKSWYSPHTGKHTNIWWKFSWNLGNGWNTYFLKLLLSFLGNRNSSLMYTSQKIE